MFEYKEIDLMGPKSAFDSGHNSFLCSAGAADDQLAELARLVGGSPEKSDTKSPFMKTPSPIQLVDDAPALEFDLEGELSKAFHADDVDPQSTLPPARQPDYPVAHSAAPMAERPEVADFPIFDEPHQETPAQSVAVEGPAHVQPAEASDLTDDVDLIGDEFERALADEVAAEFELQQEETVTAPSTSDMDVFVEAQSAVSRPPLFEEPDPVVDYAPQAKRSLATPTAASTMPAPEEMAEAIASIETTAKAQPSNDFKDELARLLGQTPGAPAPEALDNAVFDAPEMPPVPQPPTPGPMATPFDEPQIVAAPLFPHEPETSAPVAQNQSFQPPQMSDFDTLASDYSDPAADLEDFLERQSISSSSTTVSSLSTEPKAPDAPASTVQESVQPASTFEPAHAAAGAGAAIAAAVSSNRAQPQMKPEPETVARAPEPALDLPPYASPSHDPVVDFDTDDQFAAELENELQIPDHNADMDFSDKREKGRKAAFAIVALALMGGAAVVGWNAIGGNSGPAPTIMASTDPVKVKPKDAGGKIVPNQDQAVYQSVDGADKDAPMQARLNDSTEQPIEVASNAIGAKADERIAGTSGETTGGLVLKPRRVRTVVVKPDGTIVSTSADAPATGDVQVQEPVLALRPTASGVAPNPAEPTKLRTVTYSAPRAADAETTASPKPVEVARVEPKPVQPAPTATAPKDEPKPVDTTASVNAEGLPSTESAFAVQVSSQRSAAAAKQTYATLSRRYADVIGGKGVDIRRAVVKGKGAYYRVRIPADTRTAANRICSQLKSKGGDCFVTR